jgi:hypothetical protein
MFILSGSVSSSSVRAFLKQRKRNSTGFYRAHANTVSAFAGGQGCDAGEPPLSVAVARTLAVQNAVVFLMGWIKKPKCS